MTSSHCTTEKAAEFVEKSAAPVRNNAIKKRKVHVVNNHKVSQHACITHFSKFQICTNNIKRRVDRVDCHHCMYVCTYVTLTTDLAVCGALFPPAHVLLALQGVYVGLRQARLRMPEYVRIHI